MKELYRHELRWYHRLFGVWRVNKDSFDTHWGYFAPRLGLEFYLNRGGYFKSNYSISFCFIWGKFQIELPFKTKLEEGCEWPSYGFYWFENQLIFKWGSWSKHWSLPFISWVFEHHLTLDQNGDLVPYSYDMANQHSEQHNYQYILTSGEVQSRIATCTIEQRQWHRKWLPFVKMTRKSIDISFDGEVGEETGTWKGGVLGCGYDMLPEETIEQCLRRMERERKF